MVRPRSHFCPSRLKEQTHKAHWIKSVLHAGLRPKIVVLEEVACETDLNEAEMFFIAYLRAVGCDLTNATVGGEGAIGFRASTETRAKQSAAHKGRKKSPEHRAAIAEALQGHPVSSETRDRIGAAHKGNTYCVGRTLSEGSRTKMSESVKKTSWIRGKTVPTETRAKMSAAKMGNVPANKGGKHTAEAKAKIGAASKGRKHSAEARAKMSAAAKKRESHGSGMGSLPVGSPPGPPQNPGGHPNR